MGRALASKNQGISPFSIKEVTAVDNLKKRLVEPSTWAGFAAILETFKMLFPAYAGAITGLQAIAGGVAVLVREKGGAVDAGANGG